MRSTNAALTLLEVVAALALLATLLVALLAAQDRLALQTRRAELRLAALEAADRMLAEWTATVPMTIPAARGEIAGSPTLYWQISAQPDPQLLPLGIQRAMLRVSDQPRIDQQHPPLARIEFLSTATVAQEIPRP